MDDLLDQLAASPHDRDDGLRAYADQLQLAGDPFGELIVVALERARRSTPELARREAALIDEVQATLVALAPYRPHYAWRAGFLEAVRLELYGDAFEGLRALAGHPCARLVRRIELVTVDVATVELDVGRLGQLAPRFPRLVDFAIVQSRDVANNPSLLRDALGFCRAVPALQARALEGALLELDGLALPALHTLRLASLRGKDVRAIVRAEVPRLAELALAFDHVDGNLDATFGPLLHRRFPELRSFAILVRERARRWLVEALLDSPLVQGLTRLYLPEVEQLGTLELLIANADRLAHLTLVLDDTRFLDAAARRRLARAYAGRIEFRAG